MAGFNLGFGACHASCCHIYREKYPVRQCKQFPALEQSISLHVRSGLWPTLYDFEWKQETCSEMHYLMLQFHFLHRPCCVAQCVQVVVVFFCNHCSASGWLVVWRAGRDLGRTSARSAHNLSNSFQLHPPSYFIFTSSSASMCLFALGTSELSPDQAGAVAKAALSA